MIFYGNRLLIFILFTLFSVYANGKEISSYKLVDSSDPNIKVGAIQFISFIGDQCYESDVNGTSVRNGTMQKNGYQSSRDITVYSGTCFCGSRAKFEFNVDKSVLIVISKNKKVYKFKKIAKPQAVTTCSLIRNHNESGDGRNTYYVDNGNNAGYYPNPNSSNYNQNSSNTSANQDANNYTPTKRKCTFCNGTGQITKNDNASTNFGIEKPRQQCSTCGEWYNPNVFIHYHIRCSHCGGTGTAR